MIFRLSVQLCKGMVDKTITQNRRDGCLGIGRHHSASNAYPRWYLPTNQSQQPGQITWQGNVCIGSQRNVNRQFFSCRQHQHVTDDKVICAHLANQALAYNQNRLFGIALMSGSSCEQINDHSHHHTKQHADNNCKKPVASDHTDQATDTGSHDQQR